MPVIDHIMYAVPDLVAATDSLAQRLGVRPAAGGVHPGGGTHNALMSLGQSYLEVIAPDPGQSLSGNLGAEIRDAGRAWIRTWAVQVHGFNQAIDTANSLGLSTRIVPMSRKTPAGLQLNWQILFVGRHGQGHLFPFFIDWFDSPHPASSTPTGCTLAEFTVQCEDMTSMEALLAAFEITGVTVTSGAPSMRADIITPSGETVSIQGNL